MADPSPAPRTVLVAAFTSAGLFVLASLVVQVVTFEAPDAHDTNVSGGAVLVPLMGVLLVFGLAAGATASGLLGALAGWMTGRRNLAAGLAVGGLAGAALAAAFVHGFVPAPSDRPKAWCELAALLALPPMFAALAAARVQRREQA